MTLSTMAVFINSHTEKTQQENMGEDGWFWPSGAEEMKAEGYISLWTCNIALDE